MLSEENDLFKVNRNSQMLLGKTYFWTSTVKSWQHILSEDKYKNLIVDSLRELVKRECVKIYSFVIMPNHLHIVWKIVQLNKKEMPHASFNKYTALKIVQDLKSSSSSLLSQYVSTESNRKYRIWQRDPLAILIDNRYKMEQKISYSHNNPLQSHWNLVNEPKDYFWSSANFYETGKDDFGFLTHYSNLYDDPDF